MYRAGDWEWCRVRRSATDSIDLFPKFNWFLSPDKARTEEFKSMHGRTWNWNRTSIHHMPWQCDGSRIRRWRSAFQVWHWLARTWSIFDWKSGYWAICDPNIRRGGDGSGGRGMRIITREEEEDRQVQRGFESWRGREGSNGRDGREDEKPSRNFRNHSLWEKEKFVIHFRRLLISLPLRSGHSPSTASDRSPERPLEESWE